MIHWTKIKKAVEEAGGTWTDRESGEAFLAGLGVTLAEEAPVVADVVFDKAAPYGTVSGDIEEAPGARYFQSGHYFNGQGKKVG